MLLATIRAVKAGDTDAFEDIMIATERRISQLAWRILGDTEDVKDALQETFLRVFRHLDQFQEDRQFFGWVFRITVNVCRDLERRRRWRRFFVPIDETTPVGRPAQFDEALSARDELSRAIDRLPRRERLAIILRDVEELSNAEVAQILGTKETSLRVSISKARAKLRKWMEEQR